MIKLLGNNFVLAGVVALILVIIVFISLCAQFGDFLISYAKRSLAIKDSSNFIPGHGGVFDRMDSVIGGIFGYSLIIYLGYGL